MTWPVVTLICFVLFIVIIPALVLHLYKRQRSSTDNSNAGLAQDISTLKADITELKDKLALVHLGIQRSSNER